MVRLTPDTSAEDLLGRVELRATRQAQAPLSDAEPRVAPFQWVNGPVTDAVMYGGVVVLAGLQEPAPAVLEALNGVLEHGLGRPLVIGGKPVTVHKDCVVVGTMTGRRWTPEHDATTATRLSPALINRFVLWHIDEPVTAPVVDAILLLWPSVAAKPTLRSVVTSVLESAFTPTTASGVPNAATSGARASAPGLLARCLRALVAAEAAQPALLTLPPAVVSAGSPSTVDGPLTFGVACATMVRLVLGNEGGGPAHVATAAHTRMQQLCELLAPSLKFTDDTFAEAGYALPASRIPVAVKIALALKVRVGLVLEGSTGVGKTSLAKLVSEGASEPAAGTDESKGSLEDELVHHQATGTTHFVFHHDTTLDDLFGM